MKNQPEILNSDNYIEKLIDAQSGAVNDSGGEKFQHLFGRDSLQISDDFLIEYPKLAHDVIIKLAEFQGVKSCSKSEEDPGKIMHEQPTDKLLQLIWTDKNDKQKLVYFSGDSTPMFINLVNRYVKIAPNGPEILSETVQKKDGQAESIIDCVRKAANWIVDNIGDDGLVSVKRRSKLENFFGHGWKDSATAYIHEDGSLVRMTGRIVYPEIQTLSYDALLNTAELIEQDKIHTDLAKAYYLQADKIQKGVFNSLWNSEERYFVSCLEQERFNSNKMVTVNTIESTAGRMLKSRIFDNLSEEDQQKYLQPIIERLFSKNFLSEAGIRTRSREYKYIINFTDYHGSEVSWPMDTYKIACGLRRQGFSKLAEELENRVINTVNLAGKYLEFFFVRDDSSAIVDYDTKPNNNTAEILFAQFAPEEDQGWTISACHAIEAARRREEIDILQTEDQPKWKVSLQNSILYSIKRTPLYKTVKELTEAYPEKPTTRINTKKALARTALKLVCSGISEALIF